MKFMLTAVTGINWGDEGKGRVIDLLAENADIVARYQGGNNAGHTVVTEKGNKFTLFDIERNTVNRIFVRLTAINDGI